MAIYLRVLLVAGLLFTGAPSEAIAVIDYDLSSSSLSITSPWPIAVPASQVDASSSTTMRFAESGAILLTGVTRAVSLDVFSLLLNSSISPLGRMNIAGTRTPPLLAPMADATLDASGSVSFAGSPLASTRTFGSLGCVDVLAGAGACATVGLSAGGPTPVDVTQALADYNIDPTTLNVPPQTLTGSLLFSLALAVPVTGQFNLVGTEVGRALSPGSVPEMYAIWMVAIGTAGLIAYGSRRHHHRVSRRLHTPHRTHTPMAVPVA